MSVKIDKGIPMPTNGRGVGPKYPWRTMEVGNSFLGPSSLRMNLTKMNHYYAPKHFIGRLTSNGCRVWRDK